MSSMQNKQSLDDIERMADAAEYISLGDSVSRQIRINQDWSLLPNLAFTSTIAPCLITKGNSFYPAFP